MFFLTQVLFLVSIKPIFFNTIIHIFSLSFWVFLMITHSMRLCSVFFQLFFTLFFRVDNFRCASCTFTDSFANQKSAVEPLWWIFHFSYCSTPEYPFCFITSLSIFSIHWSCFITLCFSYSNVVLFSSLIVAVLKSSSAKSNIWERSDIAIDCFKIFFPPEVWVTLSFFFACLVNFCWLVFWCSSRFLLLEGGGFLGSLV